MFDLGVILATFISVFLAELGDKTQLCAFSIGANKPNAWFSVFIGSSIALVCTSLIAALCGKYVGVYISTKYLNIVTGLFFIGMGIFFLIKK
ncbi:MAG: TMEM165/GDT1 family protein [Candidatus Muiribacteriota bacterium]|jgi:putative Ca2+/H+ antiporter (TMEM165/GDT1 family)